MMEAAHQHIDHGTVNQVIQTAPSRKRTRRNRHGRGAHHQPYALPAPGQAQLMYPYAPPQPYQQHQPGNFGGQAGGFGVARGHFPVARGGNRGGDNYRGNNRGNPGFNRGNFRGNRGGFVGNNYHHNDQYRGGHQNNRGAHNQPRGGFGRGGLGRGGFGRGGFGRGGFGGQVNQPQNNPPQEDLLGGWGAQALAHHQAAAGQVPQVQQPANPLPWNADVLAGLSADQIWGNVPQQQPPQVVAPPAEQQPEVVVPQLPAQPQPEVIPPNPVEVDDDVDMPELPALPVPPPLILQQPEVPLGMDAFLPVEVPVLVAEEHPPVALHPLDPENFGLDGHLFPVNANDQLVQLPPLNQPNIEELAQIRAHAVDVNVEQLPLAYQWQYLRGDLVQRTRACTHLLQLTQVDREALFQAVRNGLDKDLAALQYVWDRVPVDILYGLQILIDQLDTYQLAEGLRVFTDEERLVDLLSQAMVNPDLSVLVVPPPPSPAMPDQLAHDVGAVIQQALAPVMENMVALPEIQLEHQQAVDIPQPKPALDKDGSVSSLDSAQLSSPSSATLQGRRKKRRQHWKAVIDKSPVPSFNLAKDGPGTSQGRRDDDSDDDDADLPPWLFDNPPVPIPTHYQEEAGPNEEVPEDEDL